MTYVPYWLMGLVSAVSIMAAIVALVLTIVLPERRALRETPARTEACHALNGTAWLDAAGVFTGCLVPPPAR
jgi:hypothetical protein